MLEWEIKCEVLTLVRNINNGHRDMQIGEPEAHTNLLHDKDMRTGTKVH